MELPPIVASAKSRPLSYDPRCNEFIYYDDVRGGKKKIYPVEKLTGDQLLNLVIARHLKNVPSTTAVLDGQTYTNEQVAEELRLQTKFGKQMLEADLNYLKFYLSQFPRDAFEDIQ